MREAREAQAKALEEAARDLSREVTDYGEGQRETIQRLQEWLLERAGELKGERRDDVQDDY